MVVFINIIFRLKKFFNKSSISFFDKIINKFYKALVIKDLYIKFIKRNQISTLIFDYPSNFDHTVKSFISLKKDLKLRIIGIEHGILIYKNYTNYGKLRKILNIIILIKSLYLINYQKN